jgi:hypothetical protein
MAADLNAKRKLVCPQPLKSFHWAHGPFLLAAIRLRKPTIGLTDYCARAASCHAVGDAAITLKKSRRSHSPLHENRINVG